ncbi:recombinase family protein [Ectobacillus ponti]|uniref:Recombinase family protein n=1 Tax=Ectobacillus ponti TaxID=2961894 RepID=A0AA42BV86_9BACI|nr:recombinase family protein [Ectobacillus ponti]MCP8971368.1 recombinase family protein [Ectobacillus ponti]
MNTAFGYIRRSSYKQLENNSVELQKARIKEFAERKGLIVPDEFIFIEDATSAFSKRASQRKELMRLKHRMLESNIPHVIFSEISRMDRTAYTFVQDFYLPLSKHMPDLAVYTTDADHPWDPSDPKVQLALLLFRQESEIKSERALGCLMSDLENETVKRPGSAIPYGYDQKNKQLVPNCAADVVTFIFFLHSWGISINKIASTLNEAAIPSPNGGTWRTSTIENILKNPAYTGQIVWEVRKGKKKDTYTFDHSHEALVDRFLLHLIDTNLKLQKEYGRLETPFLFLNKLVCQQCHSALETQNGSTKRNGKKYVYQDYVCKGCGYKLEMNEVHSSLLPRVLRHVQDMTVSEQVKERTVQYLATVEQALEEAISNCESDLDKLDRKGCIAREQNDREFAFLVMDEQKRVLHLKSSYEHSQDVLADLHEAIQSDMFFTRFDHLLESQLDNAETRLIVLYFVDEIQVAPQRPAQIIFQENPLQHLVASPNG